ncbi:MAG: hypothetical protein AB9873_04520 [Syntrophobacteraceae bacterium]
MWWPFNKRKQHAPRHAIHWHATMHCSFPEFEQNVPVEVLEISSKGARIRVERLQVGPYHLFVGDPLAKFSLAFSLKDGAVEAPVEFLWYNIDEERRSFLVDVDFVSMTDATKSAIKKVIKQLTHSASETPTKAKDPVPAEEPDSATETE